MMHHVALTLGVLANLTNCLRSHVLLINLGHFPATYVVWEKHGSLKEIDVLREVLFTPIAARPRLDYLRHSGSSLMVGTLMTGPAGSTPALSFISTVSVRSWCS